MKLWRKHLILMLTIFLTLASCDTARPSETQAPQVVLTLSAAPTETQEPVELVVWAEYFTQEIMVSDPDGAGRYGWYLKEQFEKEHPGVTVRIEYHGWDEALRQNLFNALLAETAPDIVVGENFFQPFAEIGALVPLDSVVADVQDNLIPGTYEAAEYEGQIYGLSAFTGVFGFERNCAVIEAAGLDCDAPPQTWDELLEHARAINEKGAGEYYGYTLQGPAETYLGSVLRIAVFLNQAGAAICTNACTYPHFNNPQAIPVMEFLRELYRYTPPGLAFNPDEGQVYEQLFRGQSAYQIAGSWHPQWAKDTICKDCRYSAVPLPSGGQPTTVVVGNVIYVVLKQSQHPELAAQWVKFLTRDDVQDLVFPTLGRLPSTRSALTRLHPSVDPATQVFIDQLLYNELAILPQWRQDPDALWRIYNEMLTQVLTTERPVPEILDEAQEAADEVMQP